MHQDPGAGLPSDIASFLDCRIKVRGAAGILSVLDAIGSILLIQLSGFLRQVLAGLTALTQEMSQPVVIFPIVFNRCLHDLRQFRLEVQGNGLLGSLDDPLQNVAAGLLIEIIRIVLDIAVADDLGIEGNDDQTPPDSVVVGSDLGQMVRVEDQCMGRREGEGRFIFLLREDLIRGTELLND